MKPTSLPLLVFSALVHTLLVFTQPTQYTLVQKHQGSSFLDNWNFYEGLDVNNTGNIFYVNGDFAVDQKLVFLNDAGNTVIRVDNFTDGTGNSSFLRNTVKILSDYTVYIGDLVLLDAVHMPFGCSLWPAFWTQGPVWPDNGEIDIIENINLATNNRFSLHTLDGCQHPPDSASPAGQAETGILLSTDCFNLTNFDQGCLVEVPSTTSYGAGFAAAGGGAYAMSWDEEGIKMWFFTRSEIPSDYGNESPGPDPSGWGPPTAFYPSATCDFTRFFTPQSLIFETTICGNFALPEFQNTCEGDCLAVVPIPSNYDNAYWEISFLKVFRQAGSTFTGDTILTPTPTATGSDLTPSAGASNNDNATTTRQSGSAPRTAFVSNVAVMTTLSLVLTILAVISL